MRNSEWMWCKTVGVFEDARDKESKEKLGRTKIAPKHDVFRQLVIPRYSTIQNGCVITKQMVRRKLLRERFVALAHHYVRCAVCSKVLARRYQRACIAFFSGLLWLGAQNTAGYGIRPWLRDWALEPVLFV